MPNLRVNPSELGGEFPEELGTRTMAAGMGGFPRTALSLCLHTNNVTRRSSSLTSLMSLGLSVRRIKPVHSHKEDGSLGFIRPAQWNTEMFGKIQLDALGN